jgi:hypothetical protein
MPRRPYGNFLSTGTLSVIDFHQLAIAYRDAVRGPTCHVPHTGLRDQSGLSGGQRLLQGAPLPFTFSHAAAVLPAVRGDGTGRGRLVPAVLVAGSFAPDMTYYAASVLPEAMEFGDFTHSFTGVFTVDVLIAWALVGAWLLLREPLVALLPRHRQGRVGRAPALRGATRAACVPHVVLWWYVSAALGSLTHVVWDAFTHLDRWGMRLFPVLGQEIAGSPLYWYLQYGGSAVAAVVIAAFVVRALRRAADTERWWGSRCCPYGTGGWRGRDRRLRDGGRGAAGDALVGLLGPDAKPWELIPTLCFGAGAGLVLGLALYGVAVRVWRPAPVRPSPAAVRTEPSRPTPR